VSLRVIVWAAAAALLAASTPALGQAAPAQAAAKPWKQPRTPWGDPDLQGTWPLQHLTGTPLQRDPSLGERREFTDEEVKERTSSVYQVREQRLENEEKGNKLGNGHWVEFGQPNKITSLIIDPPDGRLPAMTEEGKRRSALMRSGWIPDQTFDWVDDFDNWDRCITRSLPASMLPAYYNNGVRIWQAPGLVAIQLEMIHEVRIIPINKQPLDPKIRQWLGESRGHWEGDTLVVETTNFNAKGSATNIHTIASPPYNNTPISAEYKITERFTRTGADSLTYTATMNDPVVWTKPWTVELPWRRDDKYVLYEYACHEGNVMIPHYITSSRAKRAQEAAGGAKPGDAPKGAGK
jgi:hypothetical protein